MTPKHHRALIVTLAGLLSASVNASTEGVNKPALNTLTDAEKAQGWKLLFDGKTLNGWHMFQRPEGKPSWRVEEGTLMIDQQVSDVHHGDLVTDQVFENYELTFEWKTTDTGNSGVFINVQEDEDHKVSWQTGPEYQMLGTAHADNQDETKRSGGIFGFTSPLPEGKVHSGGQWNHSLIKQVNGKLEFYLNGNLTTEADFNSKQWQVSVAKSRFSAFPDYSVATKGHIGLQEWTSPVSFRNMKIREL